jgi:hypothetical protein
MLLTNAPSTADPNSSPVAARRKFVAEYRHRGVAQPADDPVCTSPATIANNPMKKHQSRPLHLRKYLAHIDVGDQQHRARAQQGDDRRCHVQHRMQGELDDDEAQHRHRPDEQPGVLDGAPLLQGHHFVEADMVGAQVFTEQHLGEQPTNIASASTGANTPPAGSVVGSRHRQAGEQSHQRHRTDQSPGSVHHGPKPSSMRYSQTVVRYNAGPCDGRVTI